MDDAGARAYLRHAWSLVGRGSNFFEQLLALLLVIVLYVGFRYLRVVTNTKLSMTMVYYIREAMYDKLQRVGFGFHDAISSGQLINRALTDLQNVRAFIETAVADHARRSCWSSAGTSCC